MLKVRSKEAVGSPPVQGTPFHRQRGGTPKNKAPRRSGGDVLGYRTKNPKPIERSEELMIVQPVLTVAETVAVFRRRFIAALVCIACGVLLATTAESYSRCNLSEEQRLAYVCHECRLEAADKDRMTAARRLNLVAARATKATLQGGQREGLLGHAISRTSTTV